MSAEELAQEIQETTQQSGKLVDLPEVRDWCSTGCIPLDLAISNRHPGGVPMGRIIQMYGGASTAKSVLATVIMGYALRKGFHAFFGDVEHTFDPHFASIYGLDPTHENFYYGFGFTGKKEDAGRQPETLEQMFDGWLGGILALKTRKPKLCVIDSITALPAAIEIDKDMDKQGFGAYRAKQISLGLRKYIHRLAEKNVTLLCIDQTRDDVGGYGNGEVTTGGRGLEFYSSVRLYLKHSKKVTNSSGNDIGVWVRFNCAKNKTAPPFRSGKFKILFDYGLDDIISSLAFISTCQGVSEDTSFNLTAKVKLPVCSKCGALVPSGDSCNVQGCGGKVDIVEKRSMDWRNHIEKYGQEFPLRELTAAFWYDAYKTEDRKPRVW